MSDFQFPYRYGGIEFPVPPTPSAPGLAFPTLIPYPIYEARPIMGNESPRYTKIGPVYASAGLPWFWIKDAGTVVMFTATGSPVETFYGDDATKAIADLERLSGGPSGDVTSSSNDPEPETPAR